MSLRPLQVLVALFLVAPAALAADPSPRDEVVQAEGPSRTILVVAKIQEAYQRRRLEEAARDEFKKKGVQALVGSDVLVEADMASEESFRRKVESLGVDGLLGFSVLAVEQGVKASPSVGVSVGVPVRMGPFSMFVGGNVPLAGGTEVVRNVRLRTRFFNRPGAEPAWEKDYDEKIGKDTGRLTEFLARDAVKSLHKKKLIASK